MTAKNIKHKWFDICQKSTNVLKHCFVWLISHDFIKDFTIKLNLWSQDHLSFLIWVDHVETKCFSFRSFLVKHMPALAWHSKALAYNSYLNKWITFVISFLSTLVGQEQQTHLSDENKLLLFPLIYCNGSQGTYIAHIFIYRLKPTALQMRPCNVQLWWVMCIY